MSRPAAVRGRRRKAFHGETPIPRAGAAAWTVSLSGAGIERFPAPEAFVCIRCGTTVPIDANGTSHRNHCPRCLWSRHLDVRPGDRANLCRAPMEPISIWAPARGDWRIIHRCTRCGVIKANRAAGDDSSEALRSLLDIPDGFGPCDRP